MKIKITIFTEAPDQETKEKEQRLLLEISKALHKRLELGLDDKTRVEKMEWY